MESPIFFNKETLCLDCGASPGFCCGGCKKRGVCGCFYKDDEFIEITNEKELAIVQFFLDKFTVKVDD